MAHRVTGRVQALKLDCFANLDNVTCTDPTIHIRNALAGVLVRNNTGARCVGHSLVATDVVGMFVSIENLRYRPAAFICDIEALCEVERVDRQRFACVLAGDEIIEIAVGVTGPDLLDNHSCTSSRAYAFCPPTQVSITTMSSISAAGTVK